MLTTGSGPCRIPTPGGRGCAGRPRPATALAERARLTVPATCLPAVLSAFFPTFLPAFLPVFRALLLGFFVAFFLPGIGTAQAVVAPTPAEVSPAVDATFERLAASPLIGAVLAAVRADHERATFDLIDLTEIEAPPFKEARRAQAFLYKLQGLGLSDARIDAEGNVIGIRRGTGKGPRLVVSAHLDTVFPEGTDVKVRRAEGKLHAPGISDNTRGLAVLLSWFKVLQEQQVETVGDLVFVANVGEEELGNLRGIRHLFQSMTDLDGLVGLEPVPPGDVVIVGTGSHRWQVDFKGPGGHSFAAFGQVPSAIHAMGRAVARIADIEPPSTPKTTFTVGLVKGGTSVNTIAPDARIAIDIRSDETAAMLEVEKQVLAAIDQAVIDENRRWKVDTLTVERKLIGDRPAGRMPVGSPIVEAGVRASRALGFEPRLRGASTDANVPMSMGVPAIIVSAGGRTGGFHALSEWIDLSDAWKGAQASLLTVLGLVGVQGVSDPLLAPRPK